MTEDDHYQNTFPDVLLWRRNGHGELFPRIWRGCALHERVNSLEEIEHPAIRNAMKMLDMHHIRLTYEADLPARSGLGTSSSFAVGMLNAFYALKGQYASKEILA